MGLISSTILLIVSVLPYCSTMTESILDYVFHSFLEACRVFVTLKKNSFEVSNDENMVSPNNDFLSQYHQKNHQTILKEKNKNSVTCLKNNLSQNANFFLTDSIKFSLLKLFHMLYALYPCNFVDYLK